MKRVLIVGAGIGGLTAAITLERLGVAVEIVERAPSFRALGAGITIQPNATAVLDALGVTLPADDVWPMGKVAMLDARGRPLAANDDVSEGSPFPSYSVRRPDLHEALRAAASGVELRLGVEVVGVRPRPGEGVEVELASGARERWDLVIGADGVHSTVRAAIAPPESRRLRYSGQTCWRLSIDAPDLVPETTIERWIPGRRIGVVPLSRGGIYVFLVESAPQGSVAPGSDDVAPLRRRFAAFDPRLDAILERVEAQGIPVHHGDLLDHERLDYGRDRVLLLGDAAHAMTPNMGQGAAMAIEDAAALGLLWGEVSLDELPAALAARRLARVAAIHRRSWRIGQVAHWRGKIRCALRDLLLRLTPKSVTRRAIRDTWTPGIELSDALRAKLARDRGRAVEVSTTSATDA
ncbi:MAG: FAD-dependent monooxygenase [Myxococcales bacterium]|nr:FAD-dependent monooxygenase [Myxococcales bacterium]